MSVLHPSWPKEVQGPLFHVSDAKNWGIQEPKLLSDGGTWEPSSLSGTEVMMMSVEFAFLLENVLASS